MKIYDCFTYCGEDRLLEIRFKTLFNKVDKFVIIEGNRFFNGNIKKKKFDINKFNEFRSKINYFYIEDFPKHDGNNWNYEYFQRKIFYPHLITRDRVRIIDNIVNEFYFCIIN